MQTKRILSFVLAGLLIFTVCGLAFSQENNPQEKAKATEGVAAVPQEMNKTETAKQQERAKGMLPMGLMMRELMTKSIVATSDGGIVVMSGNKLTKFDKDLNLVKEVEMKIDIKGKEEMMREMIPAQQQGLLPEEMMHKGRMHKESTNEFWTQESGVKQEAPAAQKID